MSCFCGLNRSFSECCQPYILGDKTPNTPEQLMRSRYSAYATGSSQYIFNSYAKEKQPQNPLNDIAQWAKETRWLALHINQGNNTSLSDIQAEQLPTVDFTAYYLHEKHYYKMNECSRFVIENNQWHYLDGEVSEHIELASPKRNDNCFCGSNRKFKKCCGR